MTDVDSNLPATTDQVAVPAVGEPPTRTAAPPGPRQNITTGLYPLALGVLILAFAALALWTLMATAGGGL